MTTLTFFGAAGTVTGSRFLLNLAGKNYLIDCGLFQGTKDNRLRNWEAFPVPPSEVERVFLTHAHIDHAGYLPRFCHEGFTGAINCTYPTADLCDILLKDSAHLQEEDAYWANKKGFSRHTPALPLYTLEDAMAVLSAFAPVYYGEDIPLGEGVRAKFKDAGHLLGSAFVDIKTTHGRNAKRLLFSGDLGRPADTILRDPVQVFDVDYLVLESTYGDRLHDKAAPTAELARIIRESVDRGGVLVIPAFAVGRTQTILYAIRELEERGEIPALPIYVDSPMAIDATAIFKRRLADQNLKTRILRLQGKESLRPRHVQFCDTREKSKAINKVNARAIIISSSGMATGGRILHHLAQRLPEPANTVLFVGYQAEGTRGRAMLEGSPTVKVHGVQIPVRAHLERIAGFSGHANYQEILAWLLGFNKPPRLTFVVHGEPAASAALAEKIKSHFGWETVIPGYGKSFELDV